MPDVLLIPGGLAGEASVEWFWEEPGVADDLCAAGYTTHPADRDAAARSWVEDAAFVARRAAGLPGPLGVLAGSNGCSTAVRLVLDHDLPISRLVLAWPATAGDPEADAAAGRGLVGKLEATAVDALLAGDPLRGVTPRELVDLDIPVTLVPIRPEDRFHRHRTVGALAAALPDAGVSEPTAATPSPAFAGDRARFAGIVVEALR